MISLKDKLIDVCTLLGIPHRPCTEIPYKTKLEIPLDQDSKKVLAYATKEAGRDWQYWIDTDHLLRGILRFPNQASKALESISLDLTSARAASKRHRAEFPPERTPLLRLAGIWFEPLKMAFLKLVILALVLLVSVLVIRWLNY
jgi:hypothetical protein